MSQNDDKIYPWYLIDLHAFRYHIERNYNKLTIENFANRDGKTGGIAVHLDSFPAEPAILIASEEPPPHQPMRHCIIRDCGMPVPLSRTEWLCDKHLAPVSDTVVNQYIADVLAGKYRI